MANLLSDPRANFVRAEQRMRSFARTAVQQFLREFRAAYVEAGALTAAVDGPDPADARRFWDAALGATLPDAVSASWRLGWAATTDVPITQSSLGRMDEKIAVLTDRLSRTAEPVLPAQAMDHVKLAMAQEMSVGSTGAQVQRRLAAELRWTVDGPYWTSRKTEIAQRLDDILDPLGPPGAPAREAARLNDPQVRELQRLNAMATRRIDADMSFWEVRAERIWRTESTNVYNAATLDAGASAGGRYKYWQTALDDRVRDSHIIVEGQERKVDEFFDVGVSTLMHPGDHRGAAEDVISCRCSIWFSEEPFA